MSTSPNPVCFAEQNDFALLIARGSAQDRSLRVEALIEIPLGNTAALAEAVRTAVPAGANLSCALRPAFHSLHLSTSAEAAAHAGVAGVQRFAQTLPDFSGSDAFWSSVTRARDGATPDNSPWLLSLVSAESREHTLALLDSFGLKTGRTVSATHHAVGAVTQLATSPTLLLEIGEQKAHALLVGPTGVLSVIPVSLHLDRIAEAVQIELGMKFRGSAVKLLFNPDYDFSEAAPRIAARLAASLKPELAGLRGATPATLACTGLPAAQHWLANSLATALDLAPFSPDVKGWCARAGTTFSSPDLEAALSPAWLGFLNFISTGSGASARAWDSAWQISSNGDAPSAPATPAITAPAAANTSSAKPAAPAAVPTAPTKPTPVPSPVISVKTVNTPKPVAPLPVETPAAPAPAAKVAAATPAKATASAAPVAKNTQAGSAVAYPARNAPANKTPAKKQPEPAPAKSMVAAAAAKAATPPPATKVPAVKSSVPAPAPVPATPKSKRTLIWIGVAALLAVLAGGGLAWQSKHEADARLAAELSRIETARLAEVERQRKAEEQARIEAETRRKVEIENAQKVAAAEAARQQADNEARIQAAIRLVNARGSIVVNGPAGATITIGDLPPRTAPATFGDLKLGRYPVTVALPHHETLKLDLEVKENETADAGPLKLARIAGTLILTSEPADANYEVRPAKAGTEAQGAVRTGRTPVTFQDIEPGDYVVTFTREGWQPHTETVTVGRDSTVRAACAFRTGIVKLSTTPPGASVIQSGQNLGVTPLTLLEQNPGTVAYEITLVGYDPETVEARVEPGQVVAINRELAAEDRLVRLSETDQRPVAVLTPQPEISNQKIEGSIRVDISLTVDRDGNPRDLQVTKAPTPAIGKLCLDAAAKWKFKPATVNGKPVNVRVSVPFNIVPGQ